MKTTKFFLMMFAAAMMFAGCCKYDDTNVVNRIDGLEDRITTLEGAVAALDAQIKAGAMISDITEIVEDSVSVGWRISFTGGAKAAIDIMNGEDGKTPLLEVRKGPDGDTTLWVNYGDGWQNTGTDITGPTGATGGSGGGVADGTGPVKNIADNGDGTVTITTNDSPAKTYTFAKASGAARIELVGFNDRVVITETQTADIRFRVNPSNAYVPLDLDRWQLDQTDIRETRASYVTAPTDFELVSIAPDGDLDGQYIATIKCLVNNIGIAEYAMALVLNTGTPEEPALISSPTFVLGTEERTPLIYIPETWDEVQSIVDRMLDNDTLDISALPEFPDDDPDAEEITITVAKNITIIAQMDPVFGKFGDGTSYNPFHNIYFELADDATLTLDKASFNVSTDPKPLISGNGNVIVKNSSIFHRVPIDITGDVTVYGTIAILNGGERNHTTQIVATQADDNSVPPKPGIKARNVTIYGGTVAGSTATGYVNNAGTSKGGTAIEASGNVIITGELVDTDSDGTLYNSTVVIGGAGYDGNHGGDAIVVAGTLTVTGAAGINGGQGQGEGARGGIGIVAGGDVTLSGTRYETAPDNWSYSVYIRPGTGAFSPGIPFRFSADGDGRTLTAKTAMISGVDADRSVAPPTGGYTAPYTMELRANDRALLEDCRIGWYTDRPIFSGGYYKITNPFIDTWGTFDNATELP